MIIPIYVCSVFVCFNIVDGLLRVDRGVHTPVSGILTGKKYAKQYTTKLVLILYIRILNI